MPEDGAKSSTTALDAFAAWMRRVDGRIDAIERDFHHACEAIGRDGLAGRLEALEGMHIMEPPKPRCERGEK